MPTQGQILSKLRSSTFAASSGSWCLDDIRAPVLPLEKSVVCIPAWHTKYEELGALRETLRQRGVDVPCVYVASGMENLAAGMYLTCEYRGDLPSRLGGLGLGSVEIDDVWVDV